MGAIFFEMILSWLNFLDNMIAITSLAQVFFFYPSTLFIIGMISAIVAPLRSHFVLSFFYSLQFNQPEGPFFLFPRFHLIMWLHGDQFSLDFF